MMLGQSRRLRVAHVVVTDNFAGVERYVTQTANELKERGHEITVIGGAPTMMRRTLAREVDWRAGSTIVMAMSSLPHLRKQDIVHVHMTAAEIVGLVAVKSGSGRLVGTRHFAQVRGSSSPARIFSRAFNRLVDEQIAISDFVAARIETRVNRVIPLGTLVNNDAYSNASKLVLMVQRLEAEKDSLIGLRAWAASGLGRRGWRLRVVGDGSERAALSAWADAQGLAGNVEFVGWSQDVKAHLEKASILLAPAPLEPFGLSVVEAMAAGVPVVAAAGGGHLETIGRVKSARMFRPHDADDAADALRSLAGDETQRMQLSSVIRDYQRSHLTVGRHVNVLEATYTDMLRKHGTPGSKRPPMSERSRLGE